MAKKTSNAEKIRTLLAKGLTVKDIAKKVGVSTAYVHQINWHARQAKNKAKGKAKTVKPDVSAAPAAPEQLSLLPQTDRKPSLFDNPWSVFDAVERADDDTLHSILRLVAREIAVRPTSL